MFKDENPNSRSLSKEKKCYKGHYMMVATRTKNKNLLKCQKKHKKEKNRLHQKYFTVQNMC